MFYDEDRAVRGWGPNERPYTNEDIPRDSRRANEEWRNDPERREAIRKQIEQRQQVFAEAFDHLKQADTLLRSLGRIQDDPLLARSADAVFLARVKVERDKDWIMQEPTENYIGNRAAFGSPL